MNCRANNPERPCKGGGSTPGAAGGSGGSENKGLPHQIHTCLRLGRQAFLSALLWMWREPLVDSWQYQQRQNGRGD